MSVVVQNICAVCAVPANSRCSSCAKAVYCSKEHQKADWKSHRGQCPLFKVCQSNDLGRYLVASRDVKPGDVIIQEPPLVTCPPRVTVPVCLGCFTELEDPASATQKHTPCSSNCGFPTCGATSCLDAAAHEPECAAARNRGGIQIRNFGNPHPTYEAIGVLRALELKQSAPETYAALTTLQSRELDQEEISDPEFAQYEKDKRTDALRVVGLIQDFFRKSSFQKEEILKVLSIFELNAHEIPVPEENGLKMRHVIGLYHVSSLLEHNCVPNCVKTWDSTKIQIRASVPIKRGDHLSISYVDPMWGTEDRRHFLRMSKHFSCTCSRCRDPTELGTHFSSIKCQQAGCLLSSKKGLIVPGDSNESPWKCNLCEESYPPAYVNSILDKIARDLRKVQEESYGNMEVEEAFLKKTSQMLSPNHFYLMEIKLGLAQTYGRVQDDPLPLLQPKKLQRKLQLCQELLTVFDVLQPGYNRLRSLIIYEKQAVLSTLTKRKRAVEEISVEKHREELLICIQWLSEATKVLGWEHPNSVEHRRAVGGQFELEELKLLVLAAQA